MASFKFADNKKTYSIEGYPREFVIDIGNVETMKLWRSKIEGISQVIEQLQKSPDQIDSMVELCRELTNLILDDSFDPLWDLCGHNIYAMLGLVSDLAKLISESQRNIGRDYGL